jgi:CRP-like cAMP-binding protein
MSVGNHTSNLLLAALPEQEFESLWKHLKFVTLPRRHQVESPGRKAEYVYFMESGIASIVASPRRAIEVQVGMIGREGVTGFASQYGNDRIPYSTFIQLDATAQQIRADALCNILENCGKTRSVFLAFSQAMLVQTVETAVANALGTIPERLARWLLMVRDRADSDAIPTTHEFLAVLLGCRRPGVTVTLQALEEKGFVVCGRGVITICSREGLEALAGLFYGLPEKELQRLVSTGIDSANDKGGHTDWSGASSLLERAVRC